MACATENPMSQYYCHSCKVEINPNPDYTCPRCQNGFIEELSAEFTHDNEDSSNYVYSVLMPDDDDDLAEQYDSRNSMSRSTRNSRSQRYHGVFNRSLSHRSPSNQPSHLIFTSNSGEAGSLDLLVQNLLQSMLGGTGGGLNLPNFEIHGNLEDYAFSEANFDRIITQLMNRFENCGPPPATEADIEKLPKKKVSEAMLESNVECNVCLEEYQKDDDITSLPCSHTFHSDCIEPWLTKHGTCPICRKTLSGEDTSTGNYTPDLTDLANSSPDAEQPGPSSRN